MDQKLSTEDALKISSIEELREKIDLIYFPAVSRKCTDDSPLFLLSEHVHGISLSERCRRLLEGEPTCKLCGSPAKFITACRGFSRYCSKACAENDEERKISIQKKYKQTCLDKYGSESFLSSDKFKALPNLGLNNSEEAKKKRKETNLKKFGSTAPYGNAEVAKKGADAKRKTTISAKLEAIKDEFKYVDDREPNIYEDRIFEHISCGATFSHNWSSYQRDPICRKCNPMLKGSSHAESEIADFFRHLEIPIELNKRFYYDGHKYYEADIFIAEQSLAVEYNGLYWHSDVFKTPAYHLEKHRFFRQLGVRLITIWEPDWRDKQSIVESMLKNALRKTPRRLNARDCFIVQDNMVAHTFLEDNHLRGSAKFQQSVCLMFNSEVVAVATFANSRYSKDKESYELIRFACLKDTVVRGALSKLIDYFQKKVQTKIVTYADLSHGTGKAYEQIGFKRIRETSPGYWYFNENDRLTKMYHRSVFMRKKMLKLLNLNDEGQTEAELAKMLGLAKVWDCGHLYLEKDFINATT